MILVFGGTTEGRKAVETLEEAGSHYFYSTKTGEQDIVLHHGERLDGALDRQGMLAFCRRRAIRLLVDAAHPFAAELHRTVAEVAAELQLPAIRYERLFPERAADIVWCADLDDAVRQIDCRHLLATTGVQSIGRLKALEERGIRVTYRILHRESSLRLAHRQGATDDQLCFYEAAADGGGPMADGGLPTADCELPFDAILLKESGLSGGYEQKVEAARRQGLRIYAIERPATPQQFLRVNGPYGLRRMVERLLPAFFPLKSGLTTGTCATAAAVAAATRLFRGETPAEVAVTLPDGEQISVPVGYGEGYAYCIKASGDDPDVTNGVEVRVNIEHSTSDIEFVGGEGVGRFTLPGFDYPPGEAAINRGPREMMRRNLLPFIINNRCGLRVTIGVPGGEAIARRTFNPRLGIEGGISIIGVSGIVKPFSEEAFVSSIRKCMQVAVASGTARVVINSGGKSERYVKALYPELPQQAFVEYGNYVGETLKMADELGVRQVTLGVMLGKAVKLADGQLDTHSRKGTMNKAFIAKMLAEAGCGDVDLSAITLARELWERLPAERIEAFAQTIIRHCAEHCRPLLPEGELTILLIDDEGKVRGEKGEVLSEKC